MIQKERLSGGLFEVRNQTLSRMLDIRHRLEFTGIVNQVEYINDAKSSDLISTCYSLKFIESNNIIWIAGASDIEKDHAICAELVKEKVKAILCVGSGGKNIFRTLMDHTELFVTADSIAQAVQVATIYAVPGDVVLFSPGCLLSDEYASYRERGAAFNAIVHNQHKEKKLGEVSSVVAA